MRQRAGAHAVLHAIAHQPAGSFLMLPHLQLYRLISCHLALTHPCCCCCCWPHTAGSAPLQVPALPTRICSATGGNPGSFISGPTPANPNPASPQQPPAASPAPDGDQQDPNGSSTAAPDLQEAASPSPLPDAADASPSPAPFTRSGLLLPRVPLSAGDSAPSGVQRIEAATPDGVDNTEGLPVEQQVTVGVIDSGVDRTHPDINYAGGQSFTAADAHADQDAYGEDAPELLCLQAQRQQPLLLTERSPSVAC